MRRWAACFLIISLGTVTVFAQGQPERPGTDSGGNRIDLKRLHRIAERAKSSSQIDPSRAGSVGDAHRSRSGVAERFAKQLRGKRSDFAERFRDRVQEGQQNERRELSRDKIQSRFEHRADRIEPHRLALRQRLALVDQMRDEALTQQDWEAMGRADQLERKIRNRFAVSQGGGIPFLPLPNVELPNDAKFIGPGYGPLTARNAHEQGGEFGQRVAAMPRNRQSEPGNGTGQLGDGDDGVSGDGAAGSPGSGEGRDGLRMPPPPTPQPPIGRPRPFKYPRNYHGSGNSNSGPSSQGDSAGQ